LVKLVAAGRLNMAASVGDLLPLTEAEAAVQRLQSKEGNPIRLVLVP
jgi:threonine dehydrogenase-like Zn-dependent dehydrogenase